MNDLQMTQLGDRSAARKSVGFPDGFVRVLQRVLCDLQAVRINLLVFMKARKLGKMCSDHGCV